TPSSCATITAEQPGHQLTVLADLAFRCLNISGDGLVELAGTLSSAPTSLNLNAINDQPTGTYPVAADGTNFTAYVDNDGVYSWLLIGRGREGWEFDNDGQGAIADLGQGLGTTNAFAPAAYRASIINDLLSQAGMTPRDLEIRIKRAMDPAGTLYQEARWRLPSRTTWSWIFENSFPAQHRILSGNTSPYMNNNSNTRDTPAVDNGIERIFTWPWTGHGFMKGFSYGAAITNGTNNLTSFLWESADEDHSLPYTEVYIRGDQSEGLHKNGSGTLVLLGTNTYDLATYVNDGVLELRTEGALGDPAVATIIKDGATLGFGAGISQTSIENIEIRYDGDGGSIVNLSGDNAHAGPVTVAGALTAAVSDFYGGDPGEGLDLDGDFLYAVNARGPGGLPVRDAVFSDEASEPNVMISAQNEVLNWQNPQLGDSPDDDNLEVVMQSIRWHPAPRSLTAQIKGLTLGAPYKLQLLFYEPNIAGRGFDAHLDQMVAATRFADDFTTGVGGPGRVLTLEFVATDTTHTVILNGNGAPFNDHNPILQALTLEQNIPETGFPGHARIAANAGSLTLTGPVALGKSSVQLGGAGAVFISSGLTGAQESGLHKVDSGTATLSGDNTGLLGNITVDGGTLIAASNTALGNGQETRVNAGGTLGLEGGIQVANQRLVLIGANALENLADTNTVAASSSISGTLADIGIRASTGTLIIDAPIELGYHALLVDGNADAVINGPIDGATPGALISFEQTVINANPLAYYTFDNLVDTNTLANDGSLTNSAEILGAASIAPALHGNGLAMVDGSNSLVEVNFPDTLIANAIKLPVNGNYSLGGWFNGLHDISEYRTFSRATSGDHHALIETGTHRLGMFQGGFQYSGYNVDGTAGPAIDARSGWHFFVVVGHEDNTTDYYIDNTYVGTVPRTSRSDVWRIGAWPGQTFANLIDDFFVFDRSLSDAEIDQLWRAQDGLTTSNRVVKSGAGTLTLAGDNHYRDGTRILGGTLSVDNLSGSGTGTSNVVVEAGATLAGDGSIVGAVEILAGATLAPGGIPGELAIAGGVQFTDVGTVFAVDLLGPGLSPLEFDRIISGGILSLNGTLALTRDPGYTPNNSQSLVIATANSLSGTFAGIIEGATVLDNLNTEYIISYQGSAVTLTPVDPPAEGFDVSTLSYAPGPGTNQSSVTLAWASSSGTTYRIESAPHPEGPWTPLTTGITGQAGMTLHTEVLNNVAGVKRLYLRVGAE
ncbi:MAG: autotransporter-associated beta strand protein, partial [Verrucomicrobiales bacterium]